jgi:hypothetical protein
MRIVCFYADIASPSLFFMTGWLDDLSIFYFYDLEDSMKCKLLRMSRVTSAFRDSFARRAVAVCFGDGVVEGAL